MTSIEHFAFEGCTGLWSEPVWESTYSTLSFFVDDTWGFKGAKRVLSVEPYYGGIEETTENNTIELTGLNAGKRYTIDLEIGSANGYNLHVGNQLERSHNHERDNAPKQLPPIKM